MQTLMTDDSGFDILIEWTDTPVGVRKVSRGSPEDIEKLKDRSERALNLAMNTIHAMSHRVTKTVQSLSDAVRPDEVNVEFGINLDSEVGALLAKASVGAQIKVSLKWNISEANRPKILVEG